MMGNTLFTSAILDTDTTTGSIAEPERQTALAFESMRRGGGVADYALRGEVNTEWLKMFLDPDDRPAVTSRWIIMLPNMGIWR